jgi:hypothetical protein
MCWHTWRSFRRRGAREWSTWLGVAVVLAGGWAVVTADSTELGEWAARIGIVSPVVGGALIWLRQVRR